MGQATPRSYSIWVNLGFDRKCSLSSSNTNHASALNYETNVDAYVQEELEHGALYGPFQDLDFHIHVFPLMTREKQHTTNRHTIMDLSWPKGFSVNDAIHKCKYLDSYFSLQYDHIIEKVKNIGPGALLYKVDISRAFRHIRIDPVDIDLLGLHHQYTYLDGSMLFRYHLGSGIFERCNNAIRYIMKQHGHNALMNYIDDLIYMLHSNCVIRHFAKCLKIPGILRKP